MYCNVFQYFAILFFLSEVNNQETPSFHFCSLFGNSRQHVLSHCVRTCLEKSTGKYCHAYKCNINNPRGVGRLMSIEYAITSCYSLHRCRPRVVNLIVYARRRLENESLKHRLIISMHAQIYQSWKCGENRPSTLWNHWSPRRPLKAAAE